MDKKIITTTLTILIIAGFIGVIVLGTMNGSAEPPNNEINNQREPAEPEIIIPEEDDSDEPSAVMPTVSYYFRTICPFCRDLEEYIEANDLESFIQITKIDIDENRNNMLELQKAARGCGMDINAIAVPFITSNGQCFVGLDNITEEFDRLVELEKSNQ